MSKDNRISLFSALVVGSFSSWAGITLVSFMEQNGLPQISLLLVKQTFPNQSYLSNKWTRNLRILIITFDNYEGLSWVVEDPSRGFAWAAARHMMLKAVAVPQCLTVCKCPSASCGPSSAGQWWVFSGGLPSPFGEYTSCKIGHELEFPWLNFVACTLWELLSKCLLHLTSRIQR